MIPKQITVGETTYTVKIQDHMIRDKYQGEVDYDEGTITIATRAQYEVPTGVVNLEFNDGEIENTFWHELTHAILHDMGHALTSNELFVTQFANRLTDAIRSAKL